MSNPRIALLLLVGLAICSPTQADIINYNDLENSGMFFTNITESSLDDNLPLFGQPAIVGNSLIFDDPNFELIVSQGSLDFVDGRMTVTVTAKDNLEISSLTLTEFGGYEIIGNDAIVSVSGIGFASTLTDIYQSSFQFSTSDTGIGKWSESLVFNFAAPVESFSFVMDNQLFASAGAGSAASIYKEGIEISVNTIPEPTSTAIGWLALAGTGLWRRKSRQTQPH